jgi:hypothetical protein
VLPFRSAPAASILGVEVVVTDDIIAETAPRRGPPELEAISLVSRASDGHAVRLVKVSRQRTTDLKFRIA